jgi:hypothetical protein
MYVKAADTIIVHKDARLDDITAKQISMNKYALRFNANGQLKGYRLQVLSTRSRDEAFKLKADLMQQFPAQKAYIIYQSPYFKVRIGNFDEMKDAENFKFQLDKTYTGGSYIIEDFIEPGTDQLTK